MSAPPRIHAVDRLRGLVMVLMAIDHADSPLNSGHYSANSAHFAWQNADPDPWSFATRILTHLCAPTFLFLAGVSVVLSASRAKARGSTDAQIDRHLGLRGLMLVLLDPLLMTFTFGVWWAFGADKLFLFQVLYVIGVALLVAPLLRRLPSGLLLAGSGAILIGTELVLPGNVMRADITGPDFLWPPERGPVWLSFVYTGGWYFDLVGEIGAMVMYPALPWVAVMMLGIVFGRVLDRDGAAKASKLALISGCVSLTVFGIVRGFNSWGNTLMPRQSGTFMAWLDVSKYPPGLTYLALTLGVMGLIFAWLLRLDANRGDRPVTRDPLSVLGKTALLFYLLHVPLLTVAGAIVYFSQSPVPGARFVPPLGLGATWIAWPIAVALLYPVCVWYGRYKNSHKNVVTRYL